MSALAIAKPEVIHTGIFTSWVRVKPSFFKGLAPRLESYAALVCFGLITAMGVGLSRTWGKITWTHLEKATGMSRRACEQAINQLLEDGLIRRRRSQVGTGWEYALAVRSSGDGDSKLAACRNCKRTDDMEIDADFIPVPHSFFRDLPTGCDRGMYLLVMAIIVRTMRMQDKEIVSIPCEITVDEFRTATGLERAEILSDLAKLQAEGVDVVGSEKRGRNVVYWTKPENFAKVKARAARKIHQPANKKRKGETEKAPKVEQPVEKEQTIRPVEFVTLPCGYCRHCNTYGPVDLVPELENPVKKPVATARAGPPGGKGKFWDEMERRRQEAVTAALKNMA
jgi:biotin operon repressor